MTSNYNDLTPVEGLGQFLDTIWHDTIGYVYLPTLDRENNIWKKSMFHWPLHKINVVNHILASTAAGKDIYYGPALYKEPRPIKENILGSWAIWTEFDGNSPNRWDISSSGVTKGTDETSLAAVPLPQAVPAPSLRVQSSQDGHEHIYWLLSEFNTDVDWIEGTNRSITYSTRADVSSWDATQILRPPFTVNYKRNLPVTIIEDNHNEFVYNDFASLKPVKQLVADSVNTEDLPTVETVIAKYAWDEEHFKFFMDSNIPQGERSFALMRLGYICAEMGLSDKEIYALLENADSRLKKYVGRSDRKVRLLDILNRARTKHPNALGSINFAGLSGVDSVDQDVKYIYGMQEFLDSTIEVEWAINDFLEVGGLGMVAASPGVGKTQLSIQLGIACALGIPFLGFVPAKAMRITVLSLEMSHVALKKFMQTIARHYDHDQLKLLDDNFKIIPLGESLQIDKEISRTWLYSMLEQSEPDGIIVDSLGKLTMSKLDEESVKTINHHLGVVRKRFNCFVWLIHHNRKSTENNKEPTSLDDVYGSVYVTAECTAVLLLHRKLGDKEIKIMTVKSRLSEERPMFIAERDPNLYFEIKGNSTTTFDALVGKEEESDDEDLFKL